MTKAPGLRRRPSRNRMVWSLSACCLSSVSSSPVPLRAVQRQACARRDGGSPACARWSCEQLPACDAVVLRAVVLRAAAGLRAVVLRAVVLRARRLARRGLARRGLAGRRLTSRGLARGGLACRGLASRGLPRRGLPRGGLASRRSCEPWSCVPWSSARWSSAPWSSGAVRALRSPALLSPAWHLPASRSPALRCRAWRSRVWQSCVLLPRTAVDARLSCTTQARFEPRDSLLEARKALLQLADGQCLHEVLHRLDEIATSGGCATASCRPYAPHGAFDGLLDAASPTSGPGHILWASLLFVTGDVQNLLSIVHSMLVVIVIVNDCALGCCQGRQLHATLEVLIRGVRTYHKQPPCCV